MKYINTIWALTTAVVALGFFALLAHSCTQANVSYYEAQRECLAAGHSWVPVSSSSYSANCIK
jgi:hypothetical protein